jgi:ADP-ribose pyrophosphatase
MDEFLLPSGKRGEYHYVQTNGSAMVVPVDADGLILMVNQYRYLLDRESLEFPCGSVKDGSTFDRTAWEELAEETGYSAGRIALAGAFNPFNGVTDEMCQVYVARDLRFVGETPDETEEFELLRFSPGEIDARVFDGTIWDGMSIAAWGIARPLALRPESHPGP